jgi:hypothetical protein
MMIDQSNEVQPTLGWSWMILEAADPRSKDILIEDEKSIWNQLLGM